MHRFVRPGFALAVLRVQGQYLGVTTQEEKRQ